MFNLLLSYMARIKLKTGVSWEQARDELRMTGIILTHHRHKKGGFVCYASKALRESLKRFMQEAT